MSEDKKPQTIFFSKQTPLEKWLEFESLFYGSCDCGKTLEQALLEQSIVKIRWDGKDIIRKLVCFDCLSS